MSHPQDARFGPGQGVSATTRIKRDIAEAALWTRWRLHGSPAPMPGPLKQRVVRRCGQRWGLRTLIETGTYRGAMLEAMLPYFDRLLSVELDEELARDAQRRLTPRGVVVYCGDSGEVLVKMSLATEEPAIFWLDSHWSGSGTARGDVDTPISIELDIVLSRQSRDVILIDDARDFDGTAGYPTVEAIRRAVQTRRPDLDFENSGDIIRLTPSR